VRDVPDSPTTSGKWLPRRWRRRADDAVR
jgi:hypothetical protein